GSENVRTRVVEADMVPVIATILDNYIKVVDKCREKAEEARQNALRNGSIPSSARSREHRGTSFCSRSERGSNNSEHRSSRRHPPPPSIEIPAPFAQGIEPAESSAMDMTPVPPQFAMTSPPERTTFS